MGYANKVCDLVLVWLVFVPLLNCASVVKNLSCNSTRADRHDAFGRKWLQGCSDAAPCVINASVILPDNDSYVVSLRKALPILELALRQAERDRVIPTGLRVRLIPYDDRGSNWGQMNAIHGYMNDNTNVFFGPTCEFPVASVARMVKFWNIPLVTIGAMTFDFTANKTDCESEFHLLVKAGIVDFQHISDTLLSIQDKYHWKKSAVVYGINDYSALSGEHTCKLMMQTYVDTLKKRNYTFTSLDLDTIKAGGLADSLKRTLHIDYTDAFLGPVCDYTIAPVSRYAAVWDIPVLTAGGQADAFRHKTAEYRTLTRVAGSYRHVGEALRHILQLYGWRVAGLMYHNNALSSNKGNSICHFTLEAVFTALNGTPTHRSFNEDTATPTKFRELLLDLSKSSRIVVICANPKTVREILLVAEELNMVDSGEYVFFNIELFNSMNNDSYTPWLNRNDTYERNQKAKKAYTALLTVTARTPQNEEYKNFATEVKELAEKKYNYSFGDASVSTFITAFYDAVILYARALNETIAAGGSVRDGGDITRRMWNRTIDGITGHVHINENGDRIADYSLLDMNPDTDRFEIVANYIGRTRTLEAVPGARIHWAGGRADPPPDTPQCGFDGALCETLPEYAILSIVLSTVVVIMVVTSAIIFRHYRIEAEVASMTWRIMPEELTEESKQHQLNVGRRGSQLTFISDGAISNADGKQLFIRRAIYKRNPVAIKDIPMQRIELNRPLLFELKRMKDIHHDHLVRFYGACILPKKVQFVMEYCPRGSLQDILENELNLDQMFKFSLMQDIVRGMLYLHNSEIRSHGNLKSSNCVVDARFVLKVTDFGLHSLRAHKDLDAGDYAYWQRQLWTAPELLRMSRPPPEGTQKGDVYSFGIIVHEMLTRQGPFHMVDDCMSPREIIENVKNGQKPAFRPLMDELYRDDPGSRDVVALMKRCWGEDPADRPDFSALKNHISKLNKENESGNILDNLLSRMEQYANNLEALVEERTSDYLEEKKKCEELLYQLLPKSVASQLIKGQSVIAETYDQVTIYFSDIVGFTSLSAESTPMQVVDMLNDLYTCFDSIIENFDVYKVETIGDAYMVVSGLPGRNGNLHAREIARMSLALLAQVRDFRIRHRPHTQLKLRIGMHTGPCVAGVVGLKMPRYCLFGDTVNTASRMESNGEALKIHVSPMTKEVLDTFKTFVLECRGSVEMKGKGAMTTYWLLGEKAPAELPAAVTEVGEPVVVVSSADHESPSKAPLPDVLATNLPAADDFSANVSAATPLLTNVSRDSIV